MTRDELMREVWDTTFWTSSKTIDVHLGWVRRKLGDDSRHPRLITTIRGRGLRFETERPPVARAAPLAGTRLCRAPEPAPTLAVIGGGQLARMMAQPAIALGLPLRLLAEARGRLRRPGDPRPRSSATTATSTRCARSPTAVPWSPSTTSTSPPSTCTRSRTPASPYAPGPRRSCTPRTRA